MYTLYHLQERLDEADRLETEMQVVFCGDSTALDFRIKQIPPAEIGNYIVIKTRLDKPIGYWRAEAFLQRQRPVVGKSLHLLTLPEDIRLFNN